MLGEAFYNLVMSLIEGLYGEWRTGSLLMYGIIDGCLSQDIAKLFLRDEMLKLVEFMDFSILIQEYGTRVCWKGGSYRGKQR